MWTLSVPTVIVESGRCEVRLLVRRELPRPVRAKREAACIRLRKAADYELLRATKSCSVGGASRAHFLSSRGLALGAWETLLDLILCITEEKQTRLQRYHMYYIHAPHTLEVQACRVGSLRNAHKLLLCTLFPTRHLEVCGLFRRWSGASCGWETHEDLEAIVDTPLQGCQCAYHEDS